MYQNGDNMTITLFRTSGRVKIENVNFIKFIANTAYYNIVGDAEDYSQPSIINGILVETNGTPRVVELFAIEEESGQYQEVADVETVYFANSTGYLRTSAGVTTYAGIGNGFEINIT